MRAVLHYAAAEDLLDAVTTTSGDLTEGDHADVLAAAAVHATLALAGATALQSYARVEDDDLELAEWAQAAGGWDSEVDGSEKP